MMAVLPAPGAPVRTYRGMGVSCAGRRKAARSGPGMPRGRYYAAGSAGGEVMSGGDAGGFGGRGRAGGGGALAATGALAGAAAGAASACAGRAASLESSAITELASRAMPQPAAST